MDPVSKERRREIMQKIGRENTPPERVVRQVLHRMGLRFRLHLKNLPGKPDIVLPRWKTVILVHGCFWHGCPKCYQGHRVPKTNREYWLAKVSRNQARDRRVAEELAEVGWRVVTVWECQVADERSLQQFLSGCFLRSEKGGRDAK